MAYLVLRRLWDGALVDVCKNRTSLPSARMTMDWLAKREERRGERQHENGDLWFEVLAERWPHEEIIDPVRFSLTDGRAYAIGLLGALLPPDVWEVRLSDAWAKQQQEAALRRAAKLLGHFQPRVPILMTPGGENWATKFLEPEG